MTRSDRITIGFQRLGIFLGSLAVVPGIVLIAMSVRTWWAGPNTAIDAPGDAASQAVYGCLWMLLALTLYGAARSIAWIVGGFMGRS